MAIQATKKANRTVYTACQPEKISSFTAKASFLASQD